MAQMRIFVSHSHEDDVFCRALVIGLRRAGADVWYDERNLGSGQLIDKIEVELRERPIFVVVLSPAALKSQWVRNETKWAFQRLQNDPSRVLLPVLAADINEQDIWLFLQDFKRVEAPGVKPFREAEAVVRTLHALQLTLPSEAPLPTVPQTNESAGDLIQRGNALIAQGHFADACPLFLRAIELSQSSVPAWFGLGRAYQVLQNWQASLEAFEHARSLDRNTISIWMGITIAYFELDEPEMGETAYARAVSPLVRQIIGSLDVVNHDLQQTGASQVAPREFVVRDTVKLLQRDVADINITVGEPTMNQSIRQTVAMLDDVLQTYDDLLSVFDGLSEVLRQSRRLDPYAWASESQDAKADAWHTLDDMKDRISGEIERIRRIADEIAIVRPRDNGRSSPVFLNRDTTDQLMTALYNGVMALSRIMTEVRN
jgi:tetratricopeptide (TPR) repeat protein